MTRPTNLGSGSRAPVLQPQAPTRTGPGSGVSPVPPIPTGPPNESTGRIERSAQRTDLTGGRVRGGPQLPQVSGRARSAPVAVNPAALVGRIAQGRLSVSVPLVDGAQIGAAEVRPDTQARVALAITNGRLDFERTRITFEHSDGEETSLDGPFIFNPEAFYIDADGAIRADVPCWPDPNITEEVLGTGVEAAPSDPAEFARLLLRDAQNDGVIDMAAAQTLLGQDPAAPGIDGPSDGPSATESEPASESAGGSGLDSALNLDGVDLRFSGTLKAGPLRFGDGTTLMLAPGATVTTTGSLSEMVAQIRAPVQRFSMQSEGTTISSGPGTINFDVDFGSSDAASAVRVSVHDFSLSDLRLASDAGTLDLGSVAVSGSERPTFEALTDVNGSRVTLELPDVDLSNLTGNLNLENPDGSPAQLVLGERGTGTSAQGSVRVGSDGAFEVDAQFTDFSAALLGVELADAEQFSLEMSRAEVAGSGRLQLGGSGSVGRLQLDSDREHPFTAQVMVSDAQIGQPNSGSFSADLAQESEGRLTVEHLELGQGQPTFSGNAELTVRLDELHLPVGGGQALNLTAGSHGTLTLHEMAFAEGDASPTVRATLTIDPGVAFEFDPSMVPGLSGVRARVDTETGRTLIEVDATLDREGNLSLDGNIQLRGARLQGQIVQGLVRRPPAVDIPARPLRRVRRFELEPMRQREPQAPAATRAPARITTPGLPPVELTPLQIFGELSDANMTLRVPQDELSIRGAWSKSESLNLGTSVGGYEVGVSGRASVAVDILRSPGDVVASLNIVDGEIQPGTSSLVFDPTLRFRVRGSASVGGVGDEFSFEIGLESLTIRRDASGRGYFEIDLDWPGEINSILDALDAEEWLEGEILPLVTAAMMGTPHAFPLDLDGFTSQIASAVPALSEPLIFEPQLPGYMPPPRPPAGSRAANPPREPEEPSVGERFSATMRGAEAALSISGASFSATEATTISLGGDQHIEFLPGSNLTLEGTPDNFVLSGNALIGSVAVGGDDLGGSLQSGRADVEVRVQSFDDGRPPAVSVSLTHLSAESLTAFGRRGGPQSPLKTQISTQHIDDASIEWSYGGGNDTNVVIDIPSARAHIAAGGEGTVGQHAAGAEVIAGTIEGQISIHNGQITGEFSELDLQGQGLRYLTGGTAAAGGITLNGQAVVTHVDGSTIITSRPEAPVSIGGSVRLPDGTLVNLQAATVEQIRIGPAPDYATTLVGLEADIDAVLALGGGESNEGRLDVRRAHLSGSLTINPDGLSTSGPLRLTGLDASIGGLPLELGGNFDVRFRQLDIAGDYDLEMTDSGGWALSTQERQLRGDGEMATRAVTETLRFETEEPNIWMNVPDAQFQLDLRRIEFGGDGVAMSIEGGRFDGALRSGGVRLGRPGELLETIEFERGTLIRGDLRRLHIGGTDGTHLDATIRVEGDFAQGQTNLGQRGNVHHEALSVDGSTRMAIRAVAEGEGNSGINIQMDVDLDIAWQGTTQVDGGALIRQLPTGE